MQLVACEGCGEKISKKAAACPKCGHPNKKAEHLSGGQVVGGLLVAGFGLWWMAVGFDSSVDRNVAKIEADVAADMVKQYEIAERSGDAMTKCVQAGTVAAAYLQAKNEDAYQTWTKTQKRDCKKAGVPT